jgi:hypothetical protein
MSLGAFPVGDENGDDGAEVIADWCGTLGAPVWVD